MTMTHEFTFGLELEKEVYFIFSAIKNGEVVQGTQGACRSVYLIDRSRKPERIRGFSSDYTMTFICSRNTFESLLNLATLALTLLFESLKVLMQCLGVVLISPNEVVCIFNINLFAQKEAMIC